MTLTFNSKQIHRELARISKIDTLTWMDIISDRLDKNLQAYIKDTDTLIKTISSKKYLTILRRLG